MSSSSNFQTISNKFTSGRAPSDDEYLLDSGSNIGDIIVGQQDILSELDNIQHENSSSGGD